MSVEEEVQVGLSELREYAVNADRGSCVIGKVCALAVVEHVDKLEQELQAFKDSQIIEVKGNAVLKGDWQVWIQRFNDWRTWYTGVEDPSASFLVRKCKPEPTKEERFREALGKRTHRTGYGWTTNGAIDAAKEAGLL